MLRTYLWPTIGLIVGLAVLISLGNWQLRRLAWKEDLIARMEASIKAPARPLADVLARSDGGAPPVFTRVRLEGVFVHEREFHVWSPGPNGPGWSVITPLRLREPIGAGRRYPLSHVLIIRGRVPEARKDPATRKDGQVAGLVEVVGRVRRGSVNFLTPEPNLAANQWFGRDLDRMRRRLVASLIEGAGSGAPDEAMRLVAPFYVEADKRMGGPGAPEPGPARIDLPNRHLEYAVTWYGLALALAGVWIAFMRKRLRSAS